MAIENIGLVAVTENAAKKVAVKHGGKIKAAAGTKYLLQVIGSDVSPENVTVERDGKDLKVFFEGSEKPDLTIQDFFAEGMDSQLYGVAEDGQLYAYVRTDGEGFYGQLLMNDGESAPIALGGDALGDGTPYLASTFDGAAGFVLWPWLLGLAGIGAAAAVIEHNRDTGNHHHATPTSAEPSNVKVIDDVGPIQGQLANGDVTDDSHPTITGGGVPGAVIHIIDNGTEIGSTTVDKNGTWSFTPTTGLPDGDHDVTAIQVEPGKKPSPPVDVLDFTVDTVPPADPVATVEGGVHDGGDTYSPSNTPTITGTGDPGDTITVVFPTGEKATTTVDPSGNWSVTPKDPIPEGPVDIVVTEEDPAGNTGTTVLPVVIDTIAPDAPSAWLDPASDSGVKGDGLTNDKTPTIDGKTEPGATVTVTIQPTGEVIKTVADDNGDWSVTPKQPIPDGPADIEVTATDKAGNTSQPKDLPLTIDTTPPDAPKVWLDDASDSGVKGDGITNDNTPKIDGKTEPGAEVTVTIQPTGEVIKTTADDNGDWSVTPKQPIPDGPVDIQVTATDKAGNTSAPTDLPLTIDSTAPDAPKVWLDDASDSGVKGDNVTNVTKPTIDGTAEPKSTVTVTIKETGEVLTTTADASGNWSVTPTKPLPEGPVHIDATATDAAGNTSQPGTLDLTIDTTPPDGSKLAITGVLDTVGEITGNVANGGETDDPRPVISGTGTAGDIVTVYAKDTAGSHVIGSATVGADGTWSLKPDQPLSEGRNELTAVERDVAGNDTVSQPYTITLDFTAPVAPVIVHVIDNVGDVTGEINSTTPTDDRKPVVSGTSAEANLTLVVYNIASGKYVEIGRTTTDASGNWTLTSDQYKYPLSGDVKLIAKAFDLAGNVSDPSNERDFTVLTDAPAQPTIQEVWNDDVSPNLNVQPGGYTNDNTALIKGTAEPGTHVKVYNGEQYLGTADTDEKGQWHINLPAGSPDGEYNIYAIAVNDAGMESTKAGPYNFFVDTVAPEPLKPDQWEIIDDVGEKTGPIHSGDTTDDDLPTVHNTDGQLQPPGYVVTVYDGDKPIGSTTVNPDGTWSVDVPAPQGPHDFSITVTDLAGNQGGPSNHVTFDTDIDPNAPSITGVYNDDGATPVLIARDGYTNDTTPEVHGKAKAGSLVEVYDNTNTLIGSATADSNGNWVLDASTLAEGPHTLTVRAQDPAGNWSDKVSPYNLNVDVTAPVKPTIDYADDTVGTITGHILDNGYTDDPNPVFHGTGEAGSVIHLFEIHDGGQRTEIGSAIVDASGNWQIKPTAAYSLIGNPETAYTFSADSYDKAGNSSTSNDFHLNVDFVPPVATLTIDTVAGDDIVNAIEAKEDQAISGKVTGEFTAGDIVSFKLDGTTYTAKVAADGTWSVNVPGSALVADSTQSISATLVAHDQAGNEAKFTANHPYSVQTDSGTTTLTIDTVAGDDVVNLVESKESQTISGKVGGTYLEGDKVTFTLNGHDYSASVAADGSWSVAVPGSDLVDDAAHQIVATVVGHDAAGNANAVTATHGYAVDIVPPTPDTTQLTINSVTSDNILNAAEATSPQTISGKAIGEFMVGDVVSFTLNGTSYSAQVTATGDWSVSVAGSDLAAETNIHATLMAHDAAGNVAPITADHAYQVIINPLAVSLSIDTIAGDDVVNLVESKESQTISGKAVGGFTAGDVVSFTLNGHVYSTSVSADGSWKVDVAGADLAAETNVHATLVAHDEAGNLTNVVADRAYTVDTVPPVATLTIDIVAGDDIVNGAEATTPQTVSGKATGEFLAGDIVSFKLNGTTYSAAVAADGKWSVVVAGADLAAETNIHATLVAHDAAGNTANVVADHAYTVILTPPAASLFINVVAGDDIVNLEESKVDQAITGGSTGGRAGDVVTLTVNGVSYSGTIDAQGKWSINVPGSELVADPAHRIDATLVATNIAGNSASVTASHLYSVDVTPPAATLTINVVAGDDVVNSTEAASPQTISGRAGGEFIKGDLVKFTLNGTTYSAAVDSTGNWSVTVSGADLAKETNIHATLEAHDTAGNIASITADRAYTVDTTPPVAILTINVVAGDDVLNYVESQTPQTISGKVSGEFMVGDVVSFALDGTDYKATVNAAGDWSVQVAGGDLAKANSINATLVAHDAAGNEATVTANHPYTVEITPPVAGLIINVVAGDDVVNIAESQQSQAISGKATGQFLAGDVVSFTLNGTVYSTAVDGSGNWSVQVAGSDLAKGSSINATLVAHDSAGNVTDVHGTRPYSVDLAPPVATLTINVVAGDDIVNKAESQQTQTISGKVGGEFVTGDVVSFTLNGTAYSASVSSTGNWSVQVAGSDLAKGSSIDATLIAHDAAGNEATVTATRPYSVDVIDPVATLTINVVAGDDIVNASEAMTNQTISGKAGGEFLAGDLVTFTLNGTAYSAAVNASGDWSVQVSGTDLAKGTSIDATLVAHDAAGNSSNVTANHPYTVDLSPPDDSTTKLTINNVTSDNILNLEESKTSQTISGKATGEFQAGDVVSFTLNGTAYSAKVSAAGDWSVSVAGSDLAKETNIHAVLMAHDVAGNIGSIVADRAYTVDVTPPAAPVIVSVFDDVGAVTGFLKSGDTTDDTQPKISGTAEAGSTVELYDGATKLGTAQTDASGNWTFTPTSDLADGAHAITAKAIDAAGNISPTSNEFDFTVLTGAPSVPTITHVIDDVGTITGDISKGGVTDDARPDIKGTADANATISVYDGNTLLGTTTADASGNWSFTPSTDLADGTHDITAKATNAAGSTSAASGDWPFTVDTVCAAPVITSVFDDVGSKTGYLVNGDSTDDARPDISGTAEANSKVAIYDNGTQIGSAIADASGNWSFTPTTDLSLGAHTITAKATDVAGNVSPSSGAFGFTVVAPASTGFEDFNTLLNNPVTGTMTLPTGVQVSSTDATGSTTAGLNRSGQPSTVDGACLWMKQSSFTTLTLPGAGAQKVSFWGAAVQKTTNVVTYYDASGAVLGTLNVKLGSGWNQNVFTAPEGKLVQYFTISVNDDGGGIIIDYLSWGTATTVLNSTHTLTETVVLGDEHEAAAVTQSDASHTQTTSAVADTGSTVTSTQAEHPLVAEASVTQAAAADAVAAPTVAEDAGHSVFVSTQADTFYGAPTGEGEVVTLQYSADSYFASTSNQGIHGGTGVDTLKLVGGDQTLDLTLATSQGKLTGIEIIDITGSDGVSGHVSGANTLTLSLKDVLENGQSDLFHNTDTHAVQMMVKGDDNDTVNLRDLEHSEGSPSSWSEHGSVTVGGTAYTVYEHAGHDAELLVQQGVKVNLI